MWYHILTVSLRRCQGCCSGWFSEGIPGKTPFIQILTNIYCSINMQTLVYCVNSQDAFDISKSAMQPTHPIRWITNARLLGFSSTIIRTKIGSFLCCPADKVHANIPSCTSHLSNKPHLHLESIYGLISFLLNDNLITPLPMTNEF